MTKPDTSVKDEIIAIAQDFCRLGPIEMVNDNDDHVRWVSPEGQEPKLIVEAGLSKPLGRGLGKVLTAILAIEDVTDSGTVLSSIRANRNWNGPKREVEEDAFVGMILSEFRSYASQPEMMTVRGLSRVTELSASAQTKRKRSSQRTRTAQTA